MTKAELITNVKRDRARLDELIAGIDESRMTDPTLDDGWSVKDVLAHITAWEQLCLKWMRDDRRDEGTFTETSINAFNADLYERHRDSALATVLATSRRSSARMLAAVEKLPDGAIGVPPSWSERTLGEIISGNSDEHYREHVAQIEAWLAAQKKA